MSKIAENKALEAYPINKLYNEQCMMNEDVNLQYRIGYEEGYDKAMHDFLEKARVWLIKCNRGPLVGQFKNYMQDESEN